MKIFALIATLGAACASQAILVDDFTTGGTGFTLQSGTGVFVGAGSMISGERDIYGEVLSNSLNQFLDINVGSGLAVVSNGFNLDSIVRLQYDVIGDETVGLGQSLNNNGSGSSLGLTGDRVRVHFLGNDLTVNLVGTLRLSGGQLQNVSANKLGGGAGFVDLVFQPSLLAQADSLTVEFHADPSGDFALGRIETVPEPASMTAIALGALGLISRRKRK